MRALFVGLGSIGRRHLKNLAAECEKRGLPLTVTALRHGSAPLPGDVAGLVAESVRELPPDVGFDIAFITNPTHLHGEALAALKGRCGALFIEKPIFEHTGYDLKALGLGAGQKAYVAAPMRWCGVYMALKQLICNQQAGGSQAGALRPYSVRAICSSYLPGWRPDADYRKVYSAIRAMGGGVTLDLIHEWDYLIDLFGEPEQCCSLRGQFSHLEIDSDDLSVYIARYAGFLCELHLDYFGRSYRRDVEIFTREGTLQADFGTGLLTLPDGTVQDYSEPANARYEREMAYFLSYALGSEQLSVNSPEKALRTLKITLGEN